MRCLLLVAVLVAGAARAEDTGPTVRPLLGVSGSLSDSGPGLGLQLGVRVSPVLLRLTIEVGGSATGKGYILATARAGWLEPLTSGMSLVAGAGLGQLAYGFIADNPTAHTSVLLPEVGLMFGPDRWLGKSLLSVTGFVPLEPVSHAADSSGRQIGPPHVMLTLMLAI